ncbi:drug resistance transporter, EmrB/QacA subfamily [Sporobacter termitidis DSM 10068]|uniref:Drug resistance transporter, EmrB/QacA subfamily n=1 Tax=Sporobacter termitidis DSM 10068 TaxID=1123282 RepID=A0A1M5XP70_9FIRM|nr:DHA2 family efflux MFS transporter permease subunit [Sporobacter termitidis]SHI01625.1 drug resistance transporter, EmrB/QacA subfamily [Sporobacter termitidis DSM 10068]
MADKKLKKQKTTGERLDPAVVRVSVILVLGVLAPLLDSTMINVALKTMALELETTVSVIQWVATGYALAMGIAVPISGWAADRFGGKRVYVFSMLLFFVGSVLSAVSWSIGSLICFRLVQGFGTGLMLTTLTTLIVHISGGKKLGSLMSIISIPSLLGPILGPLLGGLILNGLSWRWTFYINIPICFITLLLTLFLVPKDAGQKGKTRLDIAGILLLSPMFAAFIYGISQVSSHGGFGSPAVLVPVLAGVVLLLAFVVYALRAKKPPVIDLRLFKSRNFSASTVVMFLSGIATNGAMLLLPLYYQQVRGESVLLTGVMMIPQGLGMLLTRSLVGRLTDKTGARGIVLVSLAVTILGTIPFALAGGETSNVLLAAALLVRGAGLGGMAIPVMASVYEGLQREQVPHASIAMRILQTIGGAFGSATLAVIVQHQLTALVPVAASAAFNTAFWWAVGFTLIAAVPALFLPLRKQESPGMAA